MKSFKRIFTFALLLGLIGSAAYAEDAAQPAETAAAPAAEAAAQPAVPDAAMQEKMKLMAPGEAHKALEPLVGKWNYKSKFTMPDGKTEESAGTSETTLIYGGRFIKQEVKGTWMGQPFEGTGYIGYDNVRGEYQSIWLDGMMTGIMKDAGSYDAAAKTFSFSGINSCPMTGEKEMKTRSQIVITDNDHNTMTAFVPGPDGKEMQAMEIVSERAV